MTLPDGWLSNQEATELQRLATGKTVLELGAWKGRSTVVLAQVARYVVSVDRHQGIPEREGVESLPDYLVNVRGLDNVAIVIAQFDRIVPLFDSFFNLCFIDGSHDEQSVYEDAMMAMEHTDGYGTIAFHDFDMDSVKKGVLRAMCRQPDSVVDSLASFEGLL
jgi:predicted O-methyltransferase YrrM